MPPVDFVLMWRGVSSFLLSMQSWFGFGGIPDFLVWLVPTGLTGSSRGPAS